MIVGIALLTTAVTIAIAVLWWTAYKQVIDIAPRLECGVLEKLYRINKLQVVASIFAYLVSIVSFVCMYLLSGLKTEAVITAGVQYIVLGVSATLVLRNWTSRQPRCFVGFIDKGVAQLNILLGLLYFATWPVSYPIIWALT